MVKKIVARLVQFLVAVFFSFCALSWFGSLLLIPLAIWLNLIGLLAAIGFNSLFAAIVSIPLVVGGLYYVHKIPQMSWTLFDIGMNVVQLGFANFQRIDNIAKGAESGRVKAQKMDIELRDAE